MKFQLSSQIHAPVDVVWAFHERPDILDILTPPWQPVQVIRREGGLGPGAISEFRLWLGPFPLTWLAQHTDEYDPGRLFTDIQVSGPVESWTHRHRFIPQAPQTQGNQTQAPQTQLVDDITFELPISVLSEPLIGAFVNQRLEDMFRYRHQQTKRYCESQGH
ncbi:MAG: SRPBCC family protein [Cyanobacteria bacterium P01_A01_bin.105]